MITDYTGASNSPELWQYLVGETITGTFQELQMTRTIVLILSSGGGVEIASNGSFWSVKPDELRTRVSKRAEELAKAQAALGVTFSK